MDKNLKYSKVCKLVTDAIGEYIPKRYVDVMYDDLNCNYYVNIKNQFGTAEYQFTWLMVMTYGVNHIVNMIKRDFVFPKDGEE